MLPQAAGVLAAAASFGVASALAGPAAELAGRGGLASPNFRGCRLPTGVGATAPLAYAAGAGVLLLAGAGPPAGLWASTAGVFALGMAGLLDDAAGAGEPKGWSGHARALRRGTLTAGAFKALVGLAVAALAAASLPAGEPGERLVRAALLALGANAANTLDTRPGRAAAGVAVSTALLAFAGGAAGLAMALPAAGAALGLLPGELRLRYMLGDAGAMALGYGGAAAWALAAPLRWALAAAAACAAVVVVGDRVSLGRILARTPRPAPALRGSRSAGAGRVGKGAVRRE